jgi:hypothetical protein
MAVDEQKLALIIRLLGLAREVNLTHVLKWKIGELIERGKTVIAG